MDMVLTWEFMANLGISRVYTPLAGISCSEILLLCTWSSGINFVWRVKICLNSFSLTFLFFCSLPFLSAFYHQKVYCYCVFFLDNSENVFTALEPRETTHWWRFCMGVHCGDSSQFSKLFHTMNTVFLLWNSF